jgi:hypothetical protein
MQGLVGCWIGAVLADLEQAQSRAEQPANLKQTQLPIIIEKARIGIGDD